MPKRKIKIHSSVTLDRVMREAEEQMFGMAHPGICLACGADHSACEPDARYYQCGSCDQRAVFGASEILLMGAYHDNQEAATDAS